MGTYAWVAAAALVVLGLVLWFGPPLSEPRVRVSLAADGGLTGAVLEGSSGTYEITGTGFLDLAPGTWRLRLFASTGAVVERVVELSGERAELTADGVLSVAPVDGE